MRQGSRYYRLATGAFGFQSPGRTMIFIFWPFSGRPYRSADPPRSEGRMISTWFSWLQEGHGIRNFRVASVNSTSIRCPQVSLQQFTHSLYFTISPPVFSAPSLDKCRPHDPQDDGQDPPDNGVEKNMILQILDQGMKDCHCFLFSLIPSSLPSKISAKKASTKIFCLHRTRFPLR